jgi:hypothetical protein
MYPISEHQPAYTDKVSGTRAYGTLRLGKITDYTSAATPSFTGVSDWTYSLAARVTTWKWLSFSAIITDTHNVTSTIGIYHLSDMTISCIRYIALHCMCRHQSIR